MDKSQIAKLAQIISDYMSDRDISARQFARNADISPSYVYAILKEDDLSPTIDMLAKIAKALGIDLGELLTYCGLINTGGPQSYFSTRELFDKIPDEYKPLFKGKNESYLQFAQKMLAFEVPPEKLEIVLKAYLDLQQKQ